MPEAVAFSVEGDFITDLARSWFFDEKKDYEVSEQLLLSCMLVDTSSMPEIEIRALDDERKRICLDIIEGRSRFQGCNEFKVVPEPDAGKRRSVISEVKKRGEDKFEMLRAKNQELNQEIAQNNEEIESLKKINKTLVELAAPAIKKYIQTPITKMREHLAHTNFIDEITLQSDILGGRPASEKTKQEFAELCEQYNVYPAWNVRGTWRYILFYDKTTDEVLEHEEMLRRGFAIESQEKPEIQTVKPEINEPAHPERYGWLSPSGDFYESPWGTHEQSAIDLIKKFHWKDEQEEWEDSKGGSILARDFLNLKKNFILIDNPLLAAGRVTASYDPVKITKKQAEFLYGYFKDLGDDLMADHFIQYTAWGQ